MLRSIFSDAQRQSDRYATKANAFVHCHGLFQNAKVIDYSAGGLQLAGTFGLLSVILLRLSSSRVRAYPDRSHGHSVFGSALLFTNNSRQAIRHCSSCLGLCARAR